MYNHSKTSLFILILLLSSGCSTTSNKIWFQSTDSLVTAGKYKKALSQLSIENKKDSSLYSNIKRSDHLNAIKKIDEIRLEIDRKNWGKANNILSLAIENHTWNNQFKILKVRIKKSSDNEKRLIETKLKLAQSAVLQSKLALYDLKIRNSNSDHSWSFTKVLLRSEKDQLAKDLYDLSIQALAVQDYENAQKTYDEALQQSNELKKFELSKTIIAGINKSSQKTILSRQRSLLKKLDLALAKEDFPKIISLQKILSNAPFYGRKVDAAINRSSTIRLKQAKLLDKQADSVYRHGDVSKAISLWKQAKKLDPALNLLQEKLARASKVQSKLIQLRRKTLSK